MVKSDWNENGILITSILSGLFLFMFLFTLPNVELFQMSNLIIPSALSLVFSFGVFLILPRQKTLMDELRNISGFDVDLPIVFEWLTQENNKLIKIKKLAKNLPQEALDKIEDVIKLTNKIFENIKLDPKSYRDARRILGVYLDSTVDILDKFQMVKRKSISEEQYTASTTELVRVLEDLDDSFQGLVNKMVARDTMRLDVELEVMRHRLATDGLTVREKSEL